MTLEEAIVMQRVGFDHAACPDGFKDCNAARVIAEELPRLIWEAYEKGGYAAAGKAAIQAMRDARF